MSDGSAEFHVMMQGDDEISGAANSADASLAAITAQLNSLNQSADVTNYQLGATNNELQNTKAASDNVGISMSELNQGMEVVNKALGYAQQAYSATIGESQKYAESVRDLSAITGESAQATSDLIQVADDFQISADDLGASMRVLTKNGLVPNKETIIDLAEQYQSIQDPLAKNEFLIKNLGRASSNYTNLLSQNTDELRASFDAQSENLKWGEDQQKQAEQLRLAQDQLSDSVERWKLTIGTGLTPAMSGWVRLINDATAGHVDLQGAMARSGAAANPIKVLTQLYGEALQRNTADLEENTQKTTDNAAAQELTAERLKAMQAAEQAMSATYASELQLAQSLQGQVDSYNDSMANIAKTEADLTAQRDATPTWDTQKIADYNAKLDELPAKAAEVEAKYAESMAKLAYDNLITKLSVDGLTDAEFEQAQQAGVALGVFTQASADRAVALNNLTSSLAGGQITLDQFNKAIKDGSLAVDTASAATITGYDTITHTIQTSSEKSTEKIGNISTAQETFATQTAAKTQTAADAWQNMTGAVTGNVGTLTSSINSYIERLQAIPTNINTNVTLTLPPEGGPGGTNQSIGFGSGAQSVRDPIRVDIYINDEYHQTAVI